MELANSDAEQQILGALLLENETYHRVSSFLLDEHFYDSAHAQIYALIGKTLASGRKANPITLKHDAPDSKYLGSLIASATHVLPSMAEDYARLVRDLACRRQLVRIGEELAQRAHSSPVETTAETLIEATEASLSSLVERGTVSKQKSLVDAMTDAIEMVAYAYKRDTGLVGIPTGLMDLDALLGGLVPSELVVLAGRPAMGKAQPLDAKVLTPAGFVEMGSLKVGDEVCHPSGGTSRVLQIHPQGRVPIFRVSFADGRSTRATEQHIWSVRYPGKRGYRETTWDTIELGIRLTRVRNHSKVTVPLARPSFGVAASLPLNPYALGLLLGDGRTGGEAEFVSGDPELIAAFVADLPPGSIIGSESYYRDAHHVRVRSEKRGQNQIVAALVHLGLDGKRSADKFVPIEYLTSPVDVRLSILQGLLDTDGTVERDGTVRFCSVSRQLADDVAFLVRSLGGIARITGRKPKFTTTAGEKKDGQPAFVVSIRHTEPRSLFRLQRKLDRLPEKYRYPNLRLRASSVEPEGEAECQCITVDAPDGLYVTDDFIVTHNSALATNIALSCALNGTSVGLFTVEMSSTQIALRILAEKSGVSSHRQRAGKISEGEFDEIISAAEQLSRIGDRFAMDETGGISIAQVAARARRWKRQKKIGLLVIDYLQLMSGVKRKEAGRVQEVTEITTGLKALAKELDIPILALSQLSRKVEEREDKRPQLSDLRESGSIEQDADVVMFVFREQYYVERKQPKENTAAHIEWQAELQACAGKAEVIIGKQRHGPTGTVTLQFNPELTKFSNLAATDRLPAWHTEAA